MEQDRKQEHGTRNTEHGTRNTEHGTKKRYCQTEITTNVFGLKYRVVTEVMWAKALKNNGYLI